PQTQASAVLLRESEAEACPCDALILPNPYVGYARLSKRFERLSEEPAGIHAGAQVHPTARVAPSAVVSAGAVIAAGATIGERVYIGANVCIGEDTVIGADCRIHPN